jgi:hypothetical protein
MLADSCEAAVRALQLTSIEELDDLVHQVIIDKVKSGQLNDCDLTLRELELIRLTFVEMLQGAFHHRIEHSQKVKEGYNITIPSLVSTPSLPVIMATASPGSNGPH